MSIVHMWFSIQNHKKNNAANTDLFSHYFLLLLKWAFKKIVYISNNFINILAGDASSKPSPKHQQQQQQQHSSGNSRYHTQPGQPQYYHQFEQSRRSGSPPQPMVYQQHHHHQQQQKGNKSHICFEIGIIDHEHELS